MSNTKYLGILAVLFNVILQLETARILAFFPTPSISHQITFHPITHELVNRGHEVTVITTDPMFPKDKAPKNLTEVDIHDTSYRLWNQLMSEATQGNHSFITQMQLLGQMNVVLYEQQILLPQVQTVLKRDKNYFDLILVEAGFLQTVVLTHIYDAPLIQISSLGAFIHNLEGIGAPMHIFLYPTIFRKRVYNLSIWEKVKEVHSFVWLFVIKTIIENKSNEINRKLFGPTTPTIDELRNNVHMLFLNVNPIWLNNMPAPPGLIFTGGIHLKPTNKLPEDIQSYLDASKNGVIYVSFGTNVRTSKISPKAMQKFINVLKKVPYDVLWKWDLEDFPGQTSNIKISKWLPQADLLRHPNIKLFITQAGLQSTDEAIVAGVPLIGVPIIADQWFNAEKYVHFKIGVKIDIDSFTEKDLQEAIHTVIDDKSYRENVEKLRTVMYDQPQTSLERAVWWIEYVLRHGGAKHLRSPAANMSWAEYYELKVIFVVLIILFLIMYILVKILKFFWKLIRLSLIFKRKID